MDVLEQLRDVAREILAAGTVDWKLIAESGFAGMEVPEALDGGDATFAEVAVVLEELGRAAARTPYLGAVVLGVGTLTALEPSPARDTLLRACAAGSLVAAAALVDGADGGVADGVPFLTERTSRGWLLRGRADLVPDAADADRLLLVALDPDGTPLVVDLDPATPGLTVTPQPVLDETRRFGLVRADDLAVGDDAVRRFDGDPRSALRRLRDRAATAVACDNLGLSEAMVAATVAYAKEREQFGRAIGSFQAVKHACADMLIQASVSRQLVAAAVQQLALGSPEAGVAASMAKAYTSAAAVAVAGKAMQLHGGMGYTWESGVHAYLKRAALNRSLFGSPAAHRRRIADRYV